MIGEHGPGINKIELVIGTLGGVMEAIVSAPDVNLQLELNVLETRLSEFDLFLGGGRRVPIQIQIGGK